MQLQNTFYYARYVNGILDDILFNWFHFGGSDTITERCWLPCHFHHHHQHIVCMYAFDFRCFITSSTLYNFFFTHNYIYQFLQFHSHVMVDSCVSALLLLQTKKKKKKTHISCYTPQTPYTHRFMHEFCIVDSTLLYIVHILSDACLSCSFFTLCMVIITQHIATCGMSEGGKRCVSMCMCGIFDFDTKDETKFDG